MATRRSSSRTRSTGTTRRRSAARKSRGGLPIPKLSLGLSPVVVRSLVGIVLLVLGAVTAIALLLPGQGALTDGWRNISVPTSGRGAGSSRPCCCSRAGTSNGGRARSRRAVGPHAARDGMAYAGLLGAFQVLVDSRRRPDRPVPLGPAPARADDARCIRDPARPRRGGVADRARSAAAGAPLAGHAEREGGRVHAPGPHDQGLGRRPVASAKTGQPLTAAASAVPIEAGRRGRAARGAEPEVPGRTGVWGDGADPGIPSAVPSVGPTSSTFAPVRVPGAAAVAGAGCRGAQRQRRRRTGARSPSRCPGQPAPRRT